MEEREVKWDLTKIQLWLNANKKDYFSRWNS